MSCSVWEEGVFLNLFYFFYFWQETKLLEVVNLDLETLA